MVSISNKIIEDAVKAVRHGAAGILVSNHGGRQLDGVPATVRFKSTLLKAHSAAANITVRLLGSTLL